LQSLKFIEMILLWQESTPGRFLKLNMSYKFTFEQSLHTSTVNHGALFKLP